MARTYEKRNAKVIERACKKFIKVKEKDIRDGMWCLLHDAVQAAYDFHDNEHQSHYTKGDTYGWMLVIDGKIVDYEVDNNGDRVGAVESMLKSQVSKLPSKGIYGVVMAGMTPANFFSITYEKGIFELVTQVTRSNFSRYFQKL